MRSYELIFIVHPELDESALNELIERVKGWINDSGGKVSKADIWGKRQLAYPIHKQTEGQYVFMETQLSPEFCIELERNLRYQEPILRFLLTTV